MRRRVGQFNVRLFRLVVLNQILRQLDEVASVMRVKQSENGIITQQRGLYS